jgi:hypothetical protein
MAPELSRANVRMPPRDSWSRPRPVPSMAAKEAKTSSTLGPSSRIVSEDGLAPEVHALSFWKVPGQRFGVPRLPSGLGNLAA